MQYDEDHAKFHLVKFGLSMHAHVQVQVATHTAGVRLPPRFSEQAMVTVNIDPKQAFDIDLAGIHGKDGNQPVTIPWHAVTVATIPQLLVQFAWAGDPRSPEERPPEPEPIAQKGHLKRIK